MWLERLLSPLFPLETRRRRLWQACPPGPLRDYLAEPFASRRQDYRQARYLAVDLETNGLDPRRDHILSIGWVSVDGDSIDLASARHCLLHSAQPLNEAAVAIHHITDDVCSEGRPLSEVMDELLQVLRGKVLLAHHAGVELGFLGAACRRLYGHELLVPVVDTLWLARRRMQRRNQAIGSGSLRLANLRAHYGLPRYRAHNALSDALGTAELFLAEAADSAGNGPLKLGSLLHQ